MVRPRVKKEVFEVEEILDSRLIRSHGRTHREFLVKWKGYDSTDNTWEPRKSLCQCDDLLLAFFLEHGISDKLVEKRRKSLGHQPDSADEAGPSSSTSRYRPPTPPAGPSSSRRQTYPASTSAMPSDRPSTSKSSGERRRQPSSSSSMNPFQDFFDEKERQVREEGEKLLGDVIDFDLSRVKKEVVPFRITTPEAIRQMRPQSLRQALPQDEDSESLHAPISPSALLSSSDDESTPVTPRFRLFEGDRPQTPPIANLIFGQPEERTCQTSSGRQITYIHRPFRRLGTPEDEQEPDGKKQRVLPPLPQWAHRSPARKTVRDNKNLPNPPPPPP